MFEKSEGIANLSAALVKAQASFAPVRFNAVNPFLKNKYADLGAIIESARPVLAANGLAVSQLVTSEGDDVGVTTMLLHASGEWISSTVHMPTGEERGKSSAQVAGSVITYLRRYSLASILGMYADEDGDGNNNKPAAQSKPAPAAPPPPEPAEVRVAEPPTQTGNVNQSNTTNGNGKGSRPMEPEALKRAIASKAGKHVGSIISAGAKGLMVGQINSLFDGDENKRHQFTKFLTGYGSTKDMPANVCQSILDWLADADMAKREANAVIGYLDGQNGQMSLPA